MSVGSSVISETLDQSLSSFALTRPFDSNQEAAAERPLAKPFGALDSPSCLSNWARPSAQLRWKEIKVRSETIQSRSLGLRPSRLMGITKFSFLSLVRFSARVRSFKGFEREFCNPHPTCWR